MQVETYYDGISNIGEIILSVRIIIKFILTKSSYFFYYVV